MIIVGQALVSEDILEKKFECQILSCKGACCVQGDAGAPLDEAELEVIAAEYDNVRPFMAEAGLEKVAEVGFHEKDRDGDLVTTCLPGGECVFVVYDGRYCRLCHRKGLFRRENMVSQALELSFVSHQGQAIRRIHGIELPQLEFVFRSV